MPIDCPPDAIRRRCSRAVQAAVNGRTPRCAGVYATDLSAMRHGFTGVCGQFVTQPRHTAAPFIVRLVRFTSDTRPCPEHLLVLNRAGAVTFRPPHRPARLLEDG